MKPASDTHKQKDWVSLSTFAFVSEKPREISFQDHLIPYVGQGDSGAMPWAVYGTTSFHACSYFAAHHAQRSKQMLMVLTLWYEIEGFADATNTLPRSLQECGGFLHTGRISASFRSEIHEELLSILEADREPSQLTRLKKLSWPELLLREPAVVRSWAAKQSQIDVIVHPVHQGWDKRAKEPVQVASFKRKRDHIRTIEARYFPDVVATI